ncbi:MAG: hypothetical protein QXI12_13090 [Candidatus Methanomethyliaceae archaeon]
MLKLVVGAFLLAQTVVQLFLDGKFRIHYQEHDPITWGNVAYDRICQGLKRITTGEWPIIRFSSSPHHPFSVYRYLTFAVPKTCTYAYHDVGDIGYFMDRTLYDILGLNDKEIAHDPRPYPRRATYGKPFYDLLIKRNTDIFLFTKWCYESPLTEITPFRGHDRFYLTQQFQSKYAFTNIITPF